jgi:Tfp pilus assembly protein PilZ
MEKRKHKRYKKRLETRVTSGEMGLSAMTSDLSAGGLFIRTQRGFSPGSTVVIDLYLPDKKVCRVKGVVRRSLRTSLPVVKSGMGIELQNVDKDSCYIEFLETFVIDQDTPDTTLSPDSITNKTEKRESNDGEEPYVKITCPACNVKNRVLKTKLSLGPRCGKCGRVLETRGTS